MLTDVADIRENIFYSMHQTYDNWLFFMFSIILCTSFSPSFYPCHLRVFINTFFSIHALCLPWLLVLLLSFLLDLLLHCGFSGHPMSTFCKGNISWHLVVCLVSSWSLLPSPHRFPALSLSLSLSLWMKQTTATSGTCLQRYSWINKTVWRFFTSSLNCCLCLFGSHWHARLILKF